MEAIIDELMKVQDSKHKEFTKKLIPNIDIENIIGIKIPYLRSLSKKLLKERKEDVELFLNEMPHKFLEENMLHGFLICEFKDINEVILLTEKFLPYIDNWAVCDSFLPKIFEKHLNILIIKIKEWIKAKHTYTVRFAIGLLLKYYLGIFFQKEFLNIVANVKTESYYVNMMIAWFFAESLVKQKSETLPFIENHSLNTWVHNKTIQKAIESYRVDKEFKEYLKGLKIR